MAGSYTAKADKTYNWQDPLGKDDVICAVRNRRPRGASPCFRSAATTPSSGPTPRRLPTARTTTGASTGFILSGGDGTTASDDGKLLENLYRWLAEPGVQAGGTGVAPRPPITFTTNPVLDWDALVMPPSCGTARFRRALTTSSTTTRTPTPPSPGELKFFRALIGVHSSYSDGQGSVADYAAAAKKAGYSVIAFTETFEKLAERPSGGPAPRLSEEHLGNLRLPAGD